MVARFRLDIGFGSRLTDIRGDELGWTVMKVIIDTDPGHDDAIALLAAMASHDIDIMGLTVVAGNVPLPLTVINSLKICELAKRSEIAVYAGCDKPLERRLVTAEYVHGPTGLDGPDLPSPRMAVRDDHASDFIIRTLRDEPADSITLCPLGPLTNIATAILRDRGAISRARDIVLMGGSCFAGGNVTPAAEFNIYVDPEAAAIVLGCGVPISILPLDATHQAITTPARRDAFARTGSDVAQAVVALTGYFEQFDMARYGLPGAPLHDPCVIARLLDPALFSGRLVNVEIETDSELTRGMTVTDWWGITDRQPNATFINEVDADGYFNLLADLIARY